MIMAFTYIFLDIFSIFMAYKVLVNAPFRRQRKVYLITIGIVGMAIVVLHTILGEILVDGFVLVAGLMIPFVWIEHKGKIKKLLLWYPVLYLGISLINTLWAYLMLFFAGINLGSAAENSLFLYTSQCCSICVLTIVYLIKRNRNAHLVELEKLFDERSLVVIIIGFVCIGILISFSQLAGNDYSGDMEQWNFHTVIVALVILAFLFAVLVVQLQRISSKEKEYKLKIIAYENFIKQQEQNIRLRIEQDEKLRRFRHDFRAHIVALESLTKVGSTEEIEDYLEKMKEESSYDSVAQYTGISVIDAIINDLFREVKQNHIQVKWNGSLVLQEKISLYDMCTIFYNLLSNAIEACGKVPEEDRVIEVQNYCYEDKLYLEIKNCIPEIKSDKNFFQSQKGDLREHGFGIRNVDDTVKKYGGKFIYEFEDKWIKAEVMM